MVVAISTGKLPDDDMQLGELNLKANFKLMMIGSREEDIEAACQKPDNIGEVVDDLEVDDKVEPVHNSSIYLAKIDKRIREYKINELNPSRPGKKLLVLDIDYTLFDHRSAAESGIELMRPYLHEFLESAYEHYDIVIWSATGMRWIEEKMRLLGVSTNTNYKIMFYLDANAMISVHTAHYGVIDVKPLAVIWGLYPQYSAVNTIMFDDIKRNFLMNPRSGLRIRPFKQAHFNSKSDKELLKLSKYLKDIALNCDDFRKLNHHKWEHYKPKK